MKSFSATFLLGVLPSAAGCSGAADIPATPDLAGLVADYDSPSAMLEGSEAVVEALAQAPPLAELVAGFRSAGYVLDGVEGANTVTGKHAGARLRLQGAVHVTLRCPGTGDSPVFDAATNGSVSLTIAVAENSIRRDIGGEAVKCSLKGELLGLPIPVMVDGPIAFDLGRDLSLGQRWDGQLLISLGGELKIGDRISLKNLSARFNDSRFEHLLHLPNGSTIVIGVSSDGIRVQGRNGSWICTTSDSCLPE
jgi:hypothetical protein